MMRRATEQRAFAPARARAKPADPGSLHARAGAWRPLLLSAIMLCAAGTPAAFGHGARLGNISIGHFWTPENNGTGETAGVFGPIFNGGSVAVTLSGIDTPIARRSQICIRKDGETIWLDKADIAPMKALALAQWREHICLEGVERPLNHGDTFPVTLNFGKAGKVTIDVHVGVEGD